MKSICDIMRRSNCAGAVQYVAEAMAELRRLTRQVDEREESLEVPDEAPPVGKGKK